MKAVIRLGPATLLAVALGSAASAAEPEALALARQVQHILKANCYRCHGQEGANEGGFNYVLDHRQLIGRKKVVPGNATQSRLYRRLRSTDSPMPPEEEKPRPSQDDIALLKKWIEAGAPDFNPPAEKRAFLTTADVLHQISDDLRRLNERDRRFTRYFTLTHLYNAGLAADQLQSYRHALAKLVNSLSWERRIVVPRPIDPAHTVFRIDLRDYQWNEKVWEAILAVNPYGVLPETEAAKACAAATGCRLPCVRADWFVAAASRPPLYHEVLQLPGTDRALEKLLRVDVAENIRQERVVRAGFNGSGVSKNNRLIERHESGAVVYWKSYDFAGNTGRKNLFAHPLRRGEGDSTFRHDGGEIIFTLPNGLHGYLLVDGRGQRIAKGPIAIVSDPRRPDRAVENGISCMACHVRGMIEKDDQVRAHVLRNARAFSKSDADIVLALYPPKDRFLALLKEDGRRFRKAVEKTGAPWSATEPVVALALRFEAELDLPLAAAEAGVRPAVFLKALDRCAELAKQLGPLKVGGGTVQRQVFVDVFPELVRELRLGAFLEPRPTAYRAWIKRGNDLLRKGDPAGAIAAYTEASAIDPRNPFAFHKRAAAHRVRGALTQAIADYTQAIRLDPNEAVYHNNRGLAYYGKGDYDRAVDDFNAALRLDPRHAIAHLNRGLAFQRRGDADRANADFSAAIRIDLNYALAYHHRAAAHHQRGNHVLAIADYTVVLRLNPKSVVAYNNRGFAYYEHGDHDKASADFGAAIRLDPKHAIARYNRGLVHCARRAFDQAIADFSAAIQLDPRFAQAYLSRSHAYQEKGDTARAEADRARAHRLDPDLDRD